MDRSKNPPAFPNHDGCDPEPGMSLRDYFAAKALAGWMADSTADGTAETVATACYRLADAMLAARKAP